MKAAVAERQYLKSTPLKRRRTKIVATVGPASNNDVVLEQLIKAGVNVFRLNMSHGEHDSHRTAFQRVRATADRLGEHIAVLADLCGPKIRVGRFPNGKINLTTGSHVTITTRDVVGEPGLIPSQYEAIADDVYPGDRILLDDGMIDLQVEEVSGTEVACTVVYGGVLKDRKGINLPGVNLSAPCLTDKDYEDARFCLELGVDFLALSFVRHSSDVEELRTLITQAGQTTPIIAKIEMPQALEEIDPILDASDGIMIARGDLGVELPPEVVPIAQRKLVAQARAKNKPAIVATQMLESMIDHPRPTRAEVSDVANAVFSGADAVMLSGETASGSYPLKTVEMMDRVARQAEGFQWSEGAFGTITQVEGATYPLPLHEAIARSVAQLSRDLRVRTVVVISRSGTTAAVISAARPSAPVVAVSMDPAICRRMNLLWGVVPMHSPVDDNPHVLARRLAQDLGLAEEGQHVLAVAGLGANARESTPIIAVLQA